MNYLAYFTGLVSSSLWGGSKYGGVIGKMQANSKLRKSYFNGTLKGATYTGGLVGSLSNAEVSNSYARGINNGRLFTGSFAGQALYSSYNGVKFLNNYVSVTETSTNSSVSTKLAAGVGLDPVGKMGSGNYYNYSSNSTSTSASQNISYNK